MNSLIVGCNLSGSLGAEAMVSSVIRQLKSDDPENSVVLLALKKNEDETIARQLSLDVELVHISLFELIFILYFLYAINLVTFGLLRGLLTSRIVREYRRADRIYDVTGIAFTDKQSWMVQLKHFSWIIPSLLARKTHCYVKLSQASGPFQRPVNRLLAHLAYKSVWHFRARGHESLKNVLSLDHSFSKRDYKYAADLAFLMDPASCDEAKRILEQEIDGWHEQTSYIGLTPNLVIRNLSDDVEFSRLVDELAQMCQYFRDLGKRILLIPHSRGLADGSPNTHRPLPVGKGYDDDVELCESLAAKLGSPPDVAVLRGHYRAHEVKAIFGLMEMNIVMRFHAMVASLGMRRPTFVIGWSHKYAEVMESFGMESYVVDSSRFSFSRHKSLLDELLVDEQVAQRICVRAGSVRESALLNFDFERLQ